MFAKDFNPFSILNKNEVQKDLNDIIDKINKKSSSNYGRTAANFVVMHIAHLSTSWINALGKINEWQNQKEINRFHVAQLNYLLNHPSDLSMVVESNMVICAIMLYHSYSITQIGGNVTDALNAFWCSIKNLSIDKGFEESQKEVNDRREKNMWNILLSPIVLLMNQKYHIGKNIKLCEKYIANIVETGILYHNVDSLCTEAIFENFMKETIFVRMP